MPSVDDRQAMLAHLRNKFSHCLRNRSEVGAPIEIFETENEQEDVEFVGLTWNRGILTIYKSSLARYTSAFRAVFGSEASGNYYLAWDRYVDVIAMPKAHLQPFMSFLMNRLGPLQALAMGVESAPEAP